MEHHEKEKPEGIDNQIKDRKKEAKPMLWFLHSLQRGLLVAGIVFLAHNFISSAIFIETEGGYQSYYLIDNISYDSGVYEESNLFYNALSQKISEIITYGAICSQLETQGRIDSQKIIDVTAYTNRFIGVPDQYITAKYHLGDLLKWAQYGFTYQRKTMNRSEVADFLAPENIFYSPKTSSIEDVHEQGDSFDIVTTIWITTDHLNKYVDIEDYAFHGLYIQDIYMNPGSNELFAVIQNEEHLSLISLMRIYEERRDFWESEAYSRSYETLVNHYQTTEGKNVEDYTADFYNYWQLCKNIESAATDLYYNYNQYERYRELKDGNIFYAILTGADNERKLFTNMDIEADLSVSGNALLDIDSSFNQHLGPHNKYIKFNSFSIEYDTNTSIRESFIRQELQKYAYAYTDNTQIWIGVNTNYPNHDAFYQGHQGYRNFFPSYVQYFTAAIICFILFFILLIILTIMTGRVVDKEGRISIKLLSIDRIYTEIWTGLGIAFPIGIWYAVITNMRVALRSNWLAYNSNTIAYLLICATAYLFSLVFSLFFYSIVRRVKARSLWEDSLLKNSIIQFRRLGKTIAKLTIYAYDNAKLVTRFMALLFGIVVYHIFALNAVVNTYNYRFIFILIVLVILTDIVIGLIILRSAKAREDIIAGIKKISSGDLHHKIDERKLHGDNLILAKAVNSIGNSISTAVDISMRDERMKADLITNVSHDIKTPLTSIINYIDLIKREDLTDETVRNYVDILDAKSQRLKQLTDDLVEASKISSGNIEFIMEKINLTELVNQTIGEFEEKFAQRNLQINVQSLQDNLEIEADSRRIWRVIENLFNNIYKYAMANTRVYIEISTNAAKQVELSIKNISEQPLNFDAAELTERFIRGDVSRSTEGSGLGLSIAKSLTEAQNGRFEIHMDGDLFKVMLTFPLLEKV